MKRTELYLAILIVSASIGGIMTLESGEMMYLVLALYVGMYLIGMIRWLDEFQYYRRWNAPLASSMFVFIPLIIGLVGSSLATFTPILTKTVAHFTINLNPLLNRPFVIFVSYFSLTLLSIPYLITFFLSQRWLRLRYHPVYVFRRAVHPHVLLTLALSGMLMHAFITWREGYPLEGLELLTIGTLLLLVIYRFLTRFSPFSRERRVVRRQRSGHAVLPRSSSTSRVSSSSSNTTTSSARNDARYQANRTLRVAGPIARTRRPRANSRTSRVRGQAVSRTPMGTTSTSNGRSQASSSLNEVTRQQISSSKKMRPILPRTQDLTKDDFNCMLCFQPPTKSDEPIVLCPHCHYPAHLSEWQEWHQSTNICSRCNEKISKSYLKKPKFVIPASVYRSWRKVGR